MLIKCIGSVCVLPLSFRISRCHTRHFTGAFFCTGFNWQPCYTLHTLEGLSFFIILSKLASRLPLVAFVYGLAKATKGIQEVLVWFVIPYIKMTYSSFQRSKLYTLEGLSKIFNSQICNSHFRDAFTGFFLPLVKSRVWHLYIRNDNGSKYTEPMHLISMYASYPCICTGDNAIFIENFEQNL